MNRPKSGDIVTLATNTQTIWGEYITGTEVTLIDHTPQGYTVCLDAGQHHTQTCHRTTVPNINTPPRSIAQCGTIQGHRKHTYKQETPCEACRGAYALHRQKYRITNGLQERVLVSKHLIAEMYNHTSLWTQRLADAELGTEVIDACINYNDNHLQATA